MSQQSRHRQRMESVSGKQIQSLWPKFDMSMLDKTERGGIVPDLNAEQVLDLLFADDGARDAVLSSLGLEFREGWAVVIRSDIAPVAMAVPPHSKVNLGNGLVGLRYLREDENERVDWQEYRLHILPGILRARGVLGRDGVTPWTFPTRDVATWDIEQSEIQLTGMMKMVATTGRMLTSTFNNESAIVACGEINLIAKAGDTPRFDGKPRC